MSAISHRRAAVELRLSRDVPERNQSRHTLLLRPSADGWSLLNANGEVLFRGLGTGARRQCLEFARELGALAVVS